MKDLICKTGTYPHLQVTKVLDANKVRIIINSFASVVWILLKQLTQNKL